MNLIFNWYCKSQGEIKMWHDIGFIIKKNEDQSSISINANRYLG